MMCLACEVEKDGLIPYSKEEIAWRLRRDSVTLCDGLVTLGKCHIVTDNGEGIRFLHWKKRQYSSDSSAERTRRWRDKQKGVTSPQRHMKRHSDVLEQNREETETEKTPPNTPQDVTQMNFQIFWKNYPRKVGKGAAEKAWKKIKTPKAVLTTILTSLEWQKQSENWTKDNGEYIPHPATYLNQRRWEDEPDGNKASSQDDDNLFLRGIREERERKARKRMDGSVTQIPGSSSDHGGPKSP